MWLINEQPCIGLAFGGFMGKVAARYVRPADCMNRRAAELCLGLRGCRRRLLRLPGLGDTSCSTRSPDRSRACLRHGRSHAPVQTRTVTFRTGRHVRPNCECWQRAPFAGTPGLGLRGAGHGRAGCARRRQNAARRHAGAPVRRHALEWRRENHAEVEGTVLLGRWKRVHGKAPPSANTVNRWAAAVVAYLPKCCRTRAAI